MTDKSVNIVSLLSRIGGEAKPHTPSKDWSSLPRFPVNTNLFMGPKSYTRIVLAERLRERLHANDQQGRYVDVPPDDRF